MEKHGLHIYRLHNSYYWPLINLSCIINLRVRTVDCMTDFEADCESLKGTVTSTLLGTKPVFSLLLTYKSVTVMNRTCANVGITCMQGHKMHRMST